MPLADRITFLKDEGEVARGIRSLSAFGHTPGHMAYHIESDGRRLLLWGDSANHYVMSVQRPDWHAADDRIPVTGYHMPFPAVDDIDRAGSEYRWVPASYQLNL